MPPIINKKPAAVRTFSEEAMIAIGEIKKTITPEEKIWLFHGMILTRAVDSALKKCFTSPPVSFKDRPFQGKGFRSLGQEAIFGAATRLHKGHQWIIEDKYKGDIVAPLIRDLGVFLAFSEGDIKTSLNAQLGKDLPPTFGRDLHLGDFNRGIIIPAAPLAIATETLVGMALSIKLKKENRIAVSFIGEGGTSLGEWHEAINFASVQRLPMVFCIEDNQQALSTKKVEQCRAHNFADKALGYGIKGLTINGNDGLEVAASFAYARQYCREGLGPIILELKTMRMCGHAHHDDMMYLGENVQEGLRLPSKIKGGYINAEHYQTWRAQDPIEMLEAMLIKEKIIDKNYAEKYYAKCQENIADCIHTLKKTPWPTLPKGDQEAVFKKPLEALITSNPVVPFRFSNQGKTYLEAITQGIREGINEHPELYLIGEDIAPPYGNAFMMFRGFDDVKDRFINTPISENAIVGAMVGMAISGLKPIGEMQFNDFAASAMDQIVNNAAKLYFRTGQHVPFVLRMPYGGLRSAGPFHSQDTSPWFFRTAGLKIFAPSTPVDAYHMLKQAIVDPDPVLFYEHIALYREPAIKQHLDAPYNQKPFSATIIREGVDLTLVSVGAFVHKALNASEFLFKEHGIQVEVIDLRYLNPLDINTLGESVQKTGRLMLVQEDTLQGSIMQSLAGILAEQYFHALDAPIKVLGSRFLPIPYSPSLEDDFLLSTETIIEEAVNLSRF